MMQALIIGGGIAGLNTALRLLMAGHDVTLAEQQKGPIDKVCGEGIQPFGLELIHELGLAVEVRRQGRPFYGLEFFHDDQQVTGSFPEGKHGVGVDRGRLDTILRDACLGYSNFHLKSGFKATAEYGKSFDRVFAADGIQSRWARNYGFSVQHGGRLGMRFRIQAEPPERVQVHFKDACEIYLTPTGPDTLSVAFLIDSHKIRFRGSEIKRWAMKLFSESFPQYANHAIRDLKMRAPIVSKPGKAPNDLHLIGDAYRAFDPISGAGMSFALLCGKLAAQHAEDPVAYNRAVKPAAAAISDITNCILFFRGGGLKTRLMLRQLGKSPATFDRILYMHDAKHRFYDLGLGGMLSFLKP